VIDLKKISLKGFNAAWSRFEGENSIDTYLNTTVLNINQLLSEKEGEFVCSASDNRGASSLTFILYKEEITNEFQFYLRSLISSPIVKIDHGESNFDMLVFDYSLIEENKNEEKLFHSLNANKSFNLTNELLVAKVSQPILLRCPHTGILRNTDVKWFKSGRKLSDLSVNRFGHFYIRKISDEDFGIYSCKANKQTFNLNLEKLGKNKA